MPSDYKYADNSWGKSFYKIYSTATTYSAAKAQCESDGSFLPIPRSKAENDFIASLIPNEQIWLGINDIQQEGKYVDVHGSAIAYTNWASSQPDNMGGDEDFIHLFADKQWNDESADYKVKFVCSKTVSN